MIRYELKNWWTLEEVLTNFVGYNFLPWDNDSNFTFYHIFNENFPTAPLWENNASKDYIEDLWLLIHARYYDEVCVSTDYDCSTEEQTLTEDDYFNFMVRLVNLMVLTYPKYATLLKAYKDKENSLLGQISSVTTGVARFNDTPQNEEANDEFESDSHVTNITKTAGTSLTDGMTPIQRLKEIQDAYKSVVRDWCNEFRILFIDEANFSL